MSRIPVIGSIAAILDAAPLREPSGLPATFTNRDLACRVYATDQPTASHLSSVRRALARLVATERAERNIFGKHRRRAAEKPTTRRQDASSRPP